MKTADELANGLKAALGDNLLSAVLYGSAVSGDTTAKFSDLDVFLLLKDASLPAIAPALPLVRNWMKAGNKAPLVFSAAHFERAADVFAIEFADIKDRHRVLLGADPFANVQVERAALRHQLEFELRATLLRLRRHYLESGDSPKSMAAILAQSLSTFSTLARTTLRFLGEPASSTQKDTWRGLNRHVAMDMAALEKIWDLRDGAPKPDQPAVDNLFQGLVQAVESVINFVDLAE
jgi:hypothetical protein